MDGYETGGKYLEALQRRLEAHRPRPTFELPRSSILDGKRVAIVGADMMPQLRPEREKQRGVIYQEMEKGMTRPGMDSQQK